MCERRYPAAVRLDLRIESGRQPARPLRSARPRRSACSPGSRRRPGTIRIGVRVVNDIALASATSPWSSSPYAHPHMTVAQNIVGTRCENAVSRRPSAAPGWRRWRLLHLEDYLGQSPASFGGLAACGAGSGPRARPGGLPPRRALSISTPSSRPHARRAHRAAPAHRPTMVYVTHDQLEAMTMSDRTSSATAAAARHRHDPPPGQPLRRRLHRHAVDELIEVAEQPFRRRRLAAGAGRARSTSRRPSRSASARGHH